MKGLLMKDLKLIKAQKNVLLLIFAVAIFMTVQTDNYVFAIGYMTFIGALFALSTISGDEENNGSAFLLTLPISRKGYVREKYVFGILLGVCAWLIGTLITVMVVITKDMAALSELLAMALLLLPFLFVLLAIMFPFQLKFGGEKGRIAIIVTVGGICAVGGAIGKAADMLHIDLVSVFMHVLEMSNGAVTVLAFGAGAAILYISYRISVSIMDKKEF